MKPVVLHGGRLWLSTPTSGDIPAITACCQEPGLAEMNSSTPIPLIEADAGRFVTDMVAPEYAEGTSLDWAVRTREDGPVVGMVGLHGYGRSERASTGFAFDHAELGYWLAAQARAGGVMTCAARLVCDFAFAELRLREGEPMPPGWPPELDDAE